MDSPYPSVRSVFRRSIMSGMHSLMILLSLACCCLTGQARAQTMRTLVVNSLPSSGVNVTASPADENGESSGITAFSRTYANGTVVTLAAPATVGKNSFVKWKRDGVDVAITPTTTVTLNQNRTMTAVYYANAGGPANGSFESDFAAWTVSGNAFIQNAPPYVASDGINLVSFNGTPTSDVPADGVVTQSFATTPGISYTLAFDQGVIGPSTAQQRMQVTVTGSGSLLDQSVTKSSNGANTSQWSARSYAFTANSATTTLEFRDTSTTTDGVDMLLDNVRITPTNASTAPVTMNDAATLNAGMKVRIPVLSNDSGIFDPSTLAIVSQPSAGTASIVPPGEILYAHSGASITSDSFAYTVTGDGGQSQPATVNITISPSLRIANSTINMPATPPATTLQLVEAFPGVTFYEPACFASPPGDTRRLFVVEFSGKIKVIPDVTAVNPTPSVVLDVYQAISGRSPSEYIQPGPDREAGLLGLAFHPDYADNGYFYVSYLFAKASDPNVWYARLSRFTVPEAQRTQPAPVADAASELVLIEQRDRNYGHNGADLHFGPDGYLYWAIGDEGNEPALRANAQRIDMNFFSGMLRIDVDKKPGNLEPNAHPNPDSALPGSPFSSVNAIPRDEVSPGVFKARYSIPIDNPFVATSQGGTWDGVFNGTQIGSGASGNYVRSEFWAVGLRSPWRFSFDDPTGEIWVGDVGQDTYEEVDTLTQGGNYGWPYRDGFHTGPESTPPGFASIDPVFEYSHTGEPGDPNFKGNCVIGGRVYRGARIASLYGAYVFGDHIAGNIWSLTRPDGVTTVQRIAGMSGVATFGEDPSNGDLLLSDYFNGKIMRLVSGTTTGDFPATLGATRLFADLTDLTPSPGVVPYTPNLAFWSDHAVKSRWFCIPGETGKMAWSRDGSWTFPTGQIWVKHFDMETERGNASSPKKRIETRVLVKTATGMYGVSYRWNEEGTEATLVEDGGVGFPINVTVSGTPYSQSWTIPSRSQCLACHSQQAGFSLSFNTRQLNRQNSMNGFSGNQISLLNAYGFLNNTPDSPNLLPRHLRPTETAFPLEERVRSYFAVNCSYCHAGASGTAPPTWDGRHEVTLDNTGLINGASSVAPAPFKLIVPGDAMHSVALQRMGATNGFTRMPPLASSEIDTVNVAMVTDWINQSLSARMNYAQWRLATFGSPDSPQGEPTADPDGDGMLNEVEYLSGTPALDGSDFFIPLVHRTGSTVSLEFTIPANRSAQIETSQDLTNWSLWDVPGNDGTAFPAGNVTITGPSAEENRFFRIRIQER